ncbi:MAG TPA: radical SAM family heme chaperone HemW [Myxococcales bacterium LLY-WYZ-16_1]|nr:radical SAM family heme chaperone HemW [Myxococcales bacterium LLY-WYZ-16_1]
MSPPASTAFSERTHFAQAGGTPPVAPTDGAVYVHFPYCASKCPYCDFNSHVLDHDDDAFADAVCAELGARAPAFDTALNGQPVRSIFFGGGTPSRWAPHAVARVIQALRARWGGGEDLEITLEANPGSVDAARFDAFRAAGVNRFSIGCQSFDDRELAWLERRHDAATGREAVRRAVATGARVSLDLMYALPGQRPDDVRRSLDVALELGTEHVSAYALTVEPDTVLLRRAQQGRFHPVPDDEVAQHYEAVTTHLEEAGLLRYEVSNYARPGAECRHNLIYWLGGSYLGLGPGAHSFVTGPAGGLRREAIKAPAAYLHHAARGEFPARFEEARDGAGCRIDRLVVAFRTRWGLPETELRDLTAAVDRLERDQLVQRLHGRVRPTARGYRFADRVALALMEAADGPGISG